MLHLTIFRSIDYAAKTRLRVELKVNSEWQTLHYSSDI